MFGLDNFVKQYKCCNWVICVDLLPWKLCGQKKKVRIMQHGQGNPRSNNLPRRFTDLTYITDKSCISFSLCLLLASTDSVQPERKAHFMIRNKLFEKCFKDPIICIDFYAFENGCAPPPPQQIVVVFFLFFFGGGGVVIFACHRRGRSCRRMLPLPYNVNVQKYWLENFKN